MSKDREEKNLKIAKSLKSLAWNDDEVVKAVQKIDKNPNVQTIVMPAHYEAEAKAHAENTCLYVHGVSKGHKDYDKLYKQAFEKYLKEAYENSTGIDLDDVKGKRKNPVAPRLSDKEKPVFEITTRNKKKYLLEFKIGEGQYGKYASIVGWARKQGKTWQWFNGSFPFEDEVSRKDWSDLYEHVYKTLGIDGERVLMKVNPKENPTSTGLLATSTSLEGIEKLIKKFYGGSSVTLTQIDDSTWTVATGRGIMPTVEVKKKGNRFHFRKTEDKNKFKVIGSELLTKALDEAGLEKVDVLKSRGALRIKKNPVKHLEVQSLIFDKDYFTKAKAKSWAEKHGYKYGNVDENENSYRLRQVDPSEMKDSSFRTIKFTEGIKAVMGKSLTRKNPVSDLRSENVFKVEIGDYEMFVRGHPWEDSSVNLSDVDELFIISARKNKKILPRQVLSRWNKIIENGSDDTLERDLSVSQIVEAVLVSRFVDDEDDPETDAAIEQWRKDAEEIERHGGLHNYGKHVVTKKIGGIKVNFYCEKDGDNELYFGELPNGIHTGYAKNMREAEIEASKSINENKLVSIKKKGGH